MKIIITMKGKNVSVELKGTKREMLQGRDFIMDLMTQPGQHSIPGPGAV